MSDNIVDKMLSFFSFLDERKLTFILIGIIVLVAYVLFFSG